MKRIMYLGLGWEALSKITQKNIQFALTSGTLLLGT